MQKLRALIAAFILLISTFNSPVLFSSITFAEEQSSATSGSETTTSSGAGSGSSSAASSSTASAPTTTETTTTQTTPATTQITEQKPETTTTESVQPTPLPTTPPEIETTPKTEVETLPAVSTCLAPPPATTCGENQGLSTKFDDKGCVTGYDCISAPAPSTGEGGTISACPEVPPPTIECHSGESLRKTTDDKGCVVGYHCAAAQSSQPTQPVPGRPISEPVACPAYIPEKPSCENGNVVPIFDKGCLTGYSCIPSGCRQETDQSGFMRVVCKEERRCPADQEQAEHKARCYAEGGTPSPFQDQSGCTFYDCRFTREETAPNPMTGHKECPSEESIENAQRQCKSSGLAPMISFEGGCKISKCIQKRTDVCELISEPSRIAYEEKCKASGMPTVIEMDENGCQQIRCGEGSRDICQTNIPSEAYKSCDGKGGEMIVKTDKRGCVVFSECVAQGDEKDAYVDPVEEVPDTTVLLSLALKLEKLKIELQKLATESNEIAKFYASTESLDEERYNRVSSMFDSAADRIDEIKTRIKNNVETFSTDDVVEIKRDIKYIKEVTLKDILYMMLSNSDDVKETLESSRKISAKSSIEEIETNAKDCGTDGMCFDKAIRSCKPVTFQPEGRNGPLIAITGLNDKNCVLHVTMQSSDMIPPGFTKETFYMDCPIANYALGVKGPEDILKTCEGPMAKFAKQFGGGEMTGGESFPPPEGGPGGCKTEQTCATYCLDNYDECKEWVDDHPAYGPLPSREELRKYASGKIEKFETKAEKVQFNGPGGCKSQQECDGFCKNNPSECVKWCQNNPGMCPEEAEGDLRKTVTGKGIVMCSSKDEKAWQECEKKGGLPQSDPSPEKKCEIFTGCVQSGGRCECTWASGTPEHPRGCPVLCADYSYGQSSCDAQERNGCVWLSARGEGRMEGGIKCPDGICDDFEQANPDACPQDCGGAGVSRVGGVAEREAQACVGCLNNGICDVGECSECGDCLRGSKQSAQAGIRQVSNVPQQIAQQQPIQSIQPQSVGSAPVSPSSPSVQR